jgi:hypothetical protein
MCLTCVFRNLRGRLPSGTRAFARMVPDLLDGGRSGESCPEAWLLILGVDEGHVGQFHEGKDVAQIEFLIVEPFGGRHRTEGSAPRGDDRDLLALQDALRSGGGEENRLADADDLIDLRLQGRGNCEGVLGAPITMVSASTSSATSASETGRR